MMYRISPLILFSLLSFSALATSPLEIKPISPDNSRKLGWDVGIEMEADNQGMLILNVEFPQSISENLTAMRVQTWLKSSSGDTISMTSSDAAIADKSPSILIGFKSNEMDTSICVQYGFYENDDQRYIEMYCIKSLLDYLKQSNKASSKES